MKATTTWWNRYPLYLVFPALIAFFVFGQYGIVHILERDAKRHALSRTELLDSMKTIEANHKNSRDEANKQASKGKKASLRLRGGGQDADGALSHAPITGSDARPSDEAAHKKSAHHGNAIASLSSDADKMRMQASLDIARSRLRGQTDNNMHHAEALSAARDSAALMVKKEINERKQALLEKAHREEPDESGHGQEGSPEKVESPVAATATATATAAKTFVIPPPPAHINDILAVSFKATNEATATTPTGLDQERVVVGIWVYLEGIAGDALHDQDMRTILSNKQSGCESHSGQYGFALYVNGWQTSDRRLYLEFGSTRSGCHKLVSTEDFKFPSEQWTHVTIVLQKDTQALFVNGMQVAHNAVAEGALPSHEVNPGGFILGKYDLTQFPLHGRLRNLVFSKLPHEFPEGHMIDTLVTSMMLETLKPPKITVERVPAIIAYFPLNDAHKEITGATVANFVGGADGFAAPDQVATKFFGTGTFRFPHSMAEVTGGGGPKPFNLKVALNDGLGTNWHPPTAEEKSLSDAQGRINASKIKYAMKQVWGSYVEFAFGKDELHPLSKTGSDNWGGMGVTLVDALDTLWVMDLKEEFNHAKDWVARHLTFANAGSVSVFETTIRELGGLLSAYDFSQEKVFLDKAVELGEKLAPAFATSSGIAMGQVDFRSGHTSNGWQGSSAILSEMGTLQIEFRNLAQYSGQLKYEDMSMRGMKFLYPKIPSNGLMGIKVDIASGKAVDSTITFGALGDSFYEYLLKVWIQGGKKEMWYREMYDRAMNGVMDLLLATSKPGGLVFVADWNGRAQHRKMDHLVCFLPGVLALGAHTDPLGPDSNRAKRDLAVAKSLMYTCREMYHQQRSGISPEYVEFPEGRDMTVGATAPFYILRPEAAESLFVLGQLTGDPIYRDWAWEIWTAIDRHCKQPHGYGALRDVNRPEDGVDDRMESFFLGETMKYLYMAQDPDHGIDLDKYVFNTEAHPTRIFDDSHKPVSS